MSARQERIDQLTADVTKAHAAMLEAVKDKEAADNRLQKWRRKYDAAFDELIQIGRAGQEEQT